MIAGAQRRSTHSLSLGSDSLVVAILSPFVALTSEAAQRVLLAVIILDIPLQFGTHLFYREEDAALGALGGLSISATTLALAGLYLSWLIRAFANRNHRSSAAVNVNWPLIAYFAITVFSVFVAQDVSLSFFEVCLLLEACLVYFYIAGNVRTREDVVFVVSMLLAGCLLESVVMIILRFTGMPSTIWGLPTHIHIDNDPKEGFMRIGGTVGSSNFAAAYLSISLACAASVLFTNLGRLHKWFATAVLSLGSIALILTFSRGGWLAVALSLALLCIVAWRRRGLSLNAPIAILVLLALLYMPFHSLIGARLFGDDRGSAESRIPLMNLAFRITEDHPLLGVGANNFTEAMGPYLTSEFREGFLFAVHNKYLLVLAETGIGGLIAFVAFFVGTVRKGWQCWNFQDRLLSPLALGFAAGIVGHMVHMTVDVFRGRPTQQLVWLIAGLLVAMRRIGRTAPRQDSHANATRALNAFEYRKRTDWNLQAIIHATHTDLDTKTKGSFMKVLIVTAIYPTPENPAFGSFVKTQAESLKRAGVDVEMLIMRGGNRKLLYPRAIFQLRKRLQQSSFDLVHAHFGYVGLVARTQWKVPLVVTYHGDDLLGTINEHGKKALWSVIAASACKKLARHVDAAIVQSQEMARQLRKSNVFVIPHEVDLEVFKPTERGEARKALGLHPKKKYVLFAANPEIPVKRFPLARAAAYVLEQQDAFTELLVVYKEPQWRLALYMSACDVLVFPSYQEGSPNIIKQAMACNLPIVATDVGDVREVIGKTRDCYICPPDARKFALVMREILSRCPRTDGRANIHHLNAQSVSGKIIEVYEQVLQNREKRLAGRTHRDSYVPAK